MYMINIVSPVYIYVYWFKNVFFYQCKIITFLSTCKDVHVKMKRSLFDISSNYDRRSCIND